VAYDAVTVRSTNTACETALSNHKLTVEYADRRVTYRSVDEILKVIAYWNRVLDSLSTNARSRQSIAVGSKGFGWGV
jgi:hypothetical protein